MVYKTKQEITLSHQRRRELSLTSRVLTLSQDGMMKGVASSLYIFPRPPCVPTCHRSSQVCLTSQDNRFPNYPTLNLLILALKLVRKVMPVIDIYLSHALHSMIKQLRTSSYWQEVKIERQFSKISEGRYVETKRLWGLTMGEIKEGQQQLSKTKGVHTLYVLFKIHRTCSLKKSFKC